MKFHSANVTLNQLGSNILWGQRGNFLSVPTDCPQRDERLGWMGDAEVFWRTASYNANLAAFSHKFTQDIRDAQSGAGAYADVSPRVGPTGESVAGWGDAGVIIPWTAYMQFGDKIDSGGELVCDEQVDGASRRCESKLSVAQGTRE